MSVYDEKCRFEKGDKIKMKLTQLEALQVSKRVDAILHVPGNYRGSSLEMISVII